MGIDWDKTKLSPELDDLSKSLVREITEHFLESGTGVQDWERRVALGKDRRLLDALVQKGFVMNVANRFYPRFAALYYPRPDQRTRCEESTTWVLKASQSLCKARRPQMFSLTEISDEINRLAPTPVGQFAARIGMQFARDFTNYFGSFDNSSDLPATKAGVYETILDFEDLEQAWREELDQRAPVPVRTSPAPAPTREVALSRTETLTDKAKRVFVIHGRDERLRVGVFTFLRSLGLEPLEWIKATLLTGKASPYIGEILDAAFKHAQAAVVLLTPDDEARLREDFVQPSDPLYEKVFTGQARPNVLFEAGMAFASHPKETVLVQFGYVKPFSDVAGRHVVHMDNSIQKRHELASKLRTAGCSVDMDGSDWQSVGDLKPPLPENKTLSRQENSTSSGNPKPEAPESKLSEFKRILISPISRSTGETEYTLEKVDETGAVIQLGNGLLVHIPRADYHESWDYSKQKPKLVLTRKYFQGYFPGHESAEEYFLPH